MNENCPVQTQTFPDITAQSVTMTLSNSKFNSYLSKSNLNKEEEEALEKRNAVVMSNRMTHFDTLTLPPYLEETIRKEGKK